MDDANAHATGNPNANATVMPFVMLEEFAFSVHSVQMTRMGPRMTLIWTSNDYLGIVPYGRLLSRCV